MSPTSPLDSLLIHFLEADQAYGGRRPFPHAVQDLVLLHPTPLTRSEAARAMVQLGYCRECVLPSATAYNQIDRALRTNVLALAPNGRHLQVGPRSAYSIHRGASKRR